MSDRIVDLNSRGDIGSEEEIGYTSLGYQAELGVDAKVCSGFRVGFTTSFQLDGAAGLEIAQFLEACLEIEAAALVRAEIVAQASPDVGRTFGLTLSAAAQARAYVRARLAAGVRYGDLVARSFEEEASIGLEDRLIAALLRHVTLEVGAEASVELAASAAAVVAARMNLLPPKGEKPGFDIQIGAGAGFLYGKSLGVFVRGRMPTLDAYIDDASRIVLDEVLSRVGDDDAALLLRWALTTAVGCVKSGLVGGSNGALEGAATLEDTLANIAETLLGRGLQGAAEAAMVKVISDLSPPPIALIERAKAIMRVEEGERPAEVLALIAELAETMPAPSGGALEPRIVRLSAAIHALLFLQEPAHPVFDRSLPKHVIRQAGLPAGTLRFGNAAQAIAVLDGGQFEEALGSLPKPLDTVAIAVLSGAAAESIGVHDLVFAREELDKDAQLRIAQQVVMSLFEDAVQPPLESWIAQGEADGTLPPALSPMLRALLYGTPKVLLPITLDIASETNPDRLEELHEEQRSSAARIAVTLMVKQIAEMGGTMLASSAERLGTRIEQMRDRVSSNDSDLIERLVDGMLSVLDDALPSVDVSETRRKQPIINLTQSMLDELLDVAHHAFGPETWSRQRIERISSGVVELTTNVEGGEIAWAEDTSAQLRTLFRDLSDCPSLPDGAATRMREVSDDLADIAVAQARVFLLEVPKIIERHLPELTKQTALAVIEESLEELARSAQNAKARLEALVNETGDRLDRLHGRVADAVLTSLNEAEQRMKAEVEALRQETAAWVEQRFNTIIGQLDFSDARLASRVADAVLTFLGAPNAVTTNDELAEKARKEVRQIRDTVLQRLTADRFAGLEAAALGSRDGSRPDVKALHDNLMDELLSTDEAKTLAEIPTISGSVTTVDAAAASGSFGGPFRRFATALDGLETVHLQIASTEARLRALTAERDRLTANQERARTGLRDAAQIRFNAPLPVSIGSKHPVPDLPIYGKFVQLEIDFGAFDLGLIDEMPDLPFAGLTHDVDGTPVSGATAVDRYINREEAALADLGLIDIRLFVNRIEIDLSSLKRSGQLLSATIPETLLKAGVNHVLLTIAAASRLGAGPPVVRHVAFQRDANRMDRPSNVVCIDPEATVIDTHGNDHEDARRPSSSDRERIVIKNRTANQHFNLSDWTLEDAYGHRLVIRKGKLKAGDKLEIVIGRPDPQEPNTATWVEDYGYGPIALLNNLGEQLLLRDPGGRIVSQMFYGSPSANPDIVFLRERTKS